jgi:hypothetical protein
MTKLSEELASLEQQETGDEALWPWLKRYMSTITITFMVCLVEAQLMAVEPLDTTVFTTALRSAPAAELPAVAGLLVKASPPRHRTETATNVVGAAVGLNPAATPAIVGAVVRTAPETAAAVATTAARQQPALTVAIATAAAGVAPTRVAEIVVAVCRVTPAEYRSVALAAARAAPSMNKEILKAIGDVKPELKEFIENEIARHHTSEPSVVHCLGQAELAQARGAAARATPGTSAGPTPQVGGPMIPPGQIGPKPPRGDANPPGGRNYARP